MHLAECPYVSGQFLLAVDTAALIIAHPRIRQTGLTAEKWRLSAAGA